MSDDDTRRLWFDAMGQAYRVGQATGLRCAHCDGYILTTDVPCEHGSVLYHEWCKPRAEPPAGDP